MIRKKLMVKKLYNNPEVYYGKGAVSCLKAIEQTKILFLVSGTVKASDYHTKLDGYFDKKDVTEVIVPEATIDCILDINKELGGRPSPEIIVAVGGGKVLDVAKVARVMIDNPTLDFEALTKNSFCDNSNTALVAIPTTPGTGSETNAIAVVRDAAGRKTPLVNQGFVPDVAVLDHGFMKTLDIRSLYECAADAFSHAFEGSVSVAGTPMLSSIASSALALLRQGFEKLKADPADSKAHADLLQAGHLAGIVQGNAFVGACHALAHVIEEVSGVSISHGASILVTLKPTMEWLKDTTKKPVYDEFLHAYETIGFDKHRDTDVLASIDADQWADLALKDPSISTSPVRMKKENIMVLIDWIRRGT